jgi:hypothetical protein
MHITDNVGRARHSVRAAGCKPTRSAGTGLPTLPAVFAPVAAEASFASLVCHLHNPTFVSFFDSGVPLPVQNQDVSAFSKVVPGFGQRLPHITGRFSDIGKHFPKFKKGFPKPWKRF